MYSLTFLEFPCFSTALFLDTVTSCTSSCSRYLWKDDTNTTAVGRSLICKDGCTQICGSNLASKHQRFEPKICAMTICVRMERRLLLKAQLVAIITPFYNVCAGGEEGKDGLSSRPAKSGSQPCTCWHPAATWVASCNTGECDAK